MIRKDKITKILEAGVQTGADFAEIFLENTISNSMRAMSGEVEQASTSESYGAGIRLISGIDEVYGYTNDTSFESLLKLATDLSKSFNGEPGVVLPLGNERPYEVNVKRRMGDVSNEERKEILQRISKRIKDYDSKIVQGIMNLSESEQIVLIANNRGVYQTDFRPYIRVALTAVAKDETGMQDAYEGPGARAGFEFIDSINLEEIADDVSAAAIRTLSADRIKPQTMTVVLNNGFGGVIFHEACGHPLEASSVSKGLSPFVGKIGEAVASEVVTAYDDGTIAGAWGGMNTDDEGNAPQKNLLIENGILRNYLVDYRNGKRMNMEPNGSSRRQSYKYSPTSRMNSTYIAAGESKFEDLIKNTEYGLFAKKLGGGSVNPATGEFNFSVMEGYYIRDGKIAEPVKGAMLIGYGGEILKHIDMVADNLSLSQGMCGAASGSIPVDVGQPAIRVRDMTVGGGGQ
ncbi:MAG: TldD/PmbA family protein [Acholeplasmataceae bacterium]|jgi:TldD protein